MAVCECGHPEYRHDSDGDCLVDDCYCDGLLEVEPTTEEEFYSEEPAGPAETFVEENQEWDEDDPDNEIQEDEEPYEDEEN